jgi:hypothetical protein
VSRIRAAQLRKSVLNHYGPNTNFAEVTAVILTQIFCVTGQKENSTFLSTGDDGRDKFWLVIRYKHIFTLVTSSENCFHEAPLFRRLSNQNAPNVWAIVQHGFEKHEINQPRVIVMNIQDNLYTAGKKK